MLWWQSPIAAFGTHLIQVNGTEASEQVGFALDYLVVQPISSQTSSVPSLSPTPTPSPPAVLSTSQSTSQSPPTPGPPLSPLSDHKHASVMISSKSASPFPSSVLSSSTSSSSAPVVTLFIQFTQLTSPSATPTTATSSGLTAEDRDSSQPKNLGPIIGGAVGGAGVLALLVLGMLFLMRRGKRAPKDLGEEATSVAQEPKYNERGIFLFSSVTIHG